ncbi:GIP [Symbiodinium microadriaticum]|nr:GIP [Symbiodinium microadriaticum]
MKRKAAPEDPMQTLEVTRPRSKAVAAASVPETFWTLPSAWRPTMEDVLVEVSATRSSHAMAAAALVGGRALAQALQMPITWPEDGSDLEGLSSALLRDGPGQNPRRKAAGSQGLDPICEHRIQSAVHGPKERKQGVGITPPIDSAHAGEGARSGGHALRGGRRPPSGSKRHGPGDCPVGLARLPRAPKRGPELQPQPRELSIPGELLCGGGHSPR